MKALGFVIHSRENWPKIPDSGARLGQFIDQPSAASSDNPFIPSGYTYLLQLIAHDMVFTRVPFWAVDDLSVGTSNDRQVRLRLDTLYGAGPTGRPIIYAPDSKDDFSRTRLQLGAIGRAGQPAAGCPFRDLARLNPARTFSDRGNLLTEPLIADPRNDDHAIISQMTVLFHLLHNTFVALQGLPPTDDGVPDFARNTNAIFQCARDATTLLYRHVIRKDLLPRILHPEVYRLYDSSEESLLDPQVGEPGSAMPLEFSHAAFRFPHVMVRESYRTNGGDGKDGLLLRDALSATSARGRLTGSLANKWLIEWGRFFKFPDLSNPDDINLSQRIAPQIAPGLSGEPFKPISATAIVGGVAPRDLMSGGLAELWSVDDLLNAIQSSDAHEDHKKVIAQSPLARSKDRRSKEIGEWLRVALGQQAAVYMEYNGVDPNDVIKAVSDDPPLLFYILFEALKEGSPPGCNLGVLGSIIVAEVIFGEFHRGKMPQENNSDSLRQRMKSIHLKFDLPSFDETNRTVDMSNVISFVWENLRKLNAAEEKLGLIA